MLLLAILPFVSIISLVCSNFLGFEQSFEYTSDNDLDNCEADKYSNLDSDCFCYDEPASDFNYKICKEPNPGTQNNLKMIYRGLIHTPLF